MVNGQPKKRAVDRLVRLSCRPVILLRAAHVPPQGTARRIRLQRCPIPGRRPVFESSVASHDLVKPASKSSRVLQARQLFADIQPGTLKDIPRPVEISNATDNKPQRRDVIFVL